MCAQVAKRVDSEPPVRPSAPAPTATVRINCSACRSLMAVAALPDTKAHSATLVRSCQSVRLPAAVMLSSLHFSCNK